MTIHEAMNKVQSAVDRIPDIRRQVVEDLAPDIVEANREQLMKGMEPFARHFTPS